jgi:hypoxanthine phosphoribosyltransferase
MKTLLTPYQIRAGVLSITEKLMTRHNPTTPIVMIGVMRGGFMFYNDLVREMQNYNVICDFVNCKSYDGVENTGFKMLLDSRVDVTDKHVYLVDDILDSGITYEYLKVHYEYKTKNTNKKCVSYLFHQKTKDGYLVMEWTMKTEETDIKKEFIGNN